MIRAKQIFLEHGGSHVQIRRAKFDEEYESYGVTKEQEVEWVTEKLGQVCGADNFNKNMVWEFSCLCNMVAQQRNTNLIKEILHYFTSENGVDNVSQLFMLEVISDFAVQVSRKGDERRTVVIGWKKKMLQWMDDMICKAENETITRAPWYDSLDFSETDITVEYIKKYKETWEGI